MKTYYHATPRENLATIKERGLIPQIGPLSKASNEKEDGIYVFDNIENLQDAIINWLGDAFENIYNTTDDEDICVIKIEIPDNTNIRSQKNPSTFERILQQPIPPKYLSYFTTDMKPL